MVSKAVPEKLGEMGKTDMGNGQVEGRMVKSCQAQLKRKAELRFCYEVRVGRVGQADHTCMAFVWRASEP